MLPVTSLSVRISAREPLGVRPCASIGATHLDKLQRDDRNSFGEAKISWPILKVPISSTGVQPR